MPSWWTVIRELNSGIEHEWEICLSRCCVPEHRSLYYKPHVSASSKLLFSLTIPLLASTCLSQFQIIVLVIRSHTVQIYFQPFVNNTKMRFSVAAILGLAAFAAAQSTSASATSDSSVEPTSTTASLSPQQTCLAACT